MDSTRVGSGNANYVLPAAVPIFVRPPGESASHLATVGQDTGGDSVAVWFPQCLLAEARIPELVPVAVPRAWVAPAAAKPAERPDPSHNPSVREAFETFLSQAPNALPALQIQPWEAQAPPSEAYNCIAHTLGREQEIPGFGFHDFTANAQDYVGLYLSNGFLPLGSLDYENVPGVEKVVLYGVSPSDKSYWSSLRGLRSAGARVNDLSLLVLHGSRQEADGLYSSKIGTLACIASSHPEDVSGAMNGYPFAVFARIRPTT